MVEIIHAKIEIEPTLASSAGSIIMPAPIIFTAVIIVS